MWAYEGLTPAAGMLGQDEVSPTTMRSGWRELRSILWGSYPDPFRLRLGARILRLYLKEQILTPLSAWQGTPLLVSMA